LCCYLFHENEKYSLKQVVNLCEDMLEMDSPVRFVLGRPSKQVDTRGFVGHVVADGGQRKGNTSV
jgi:hypothetical protein